MAQGDPQLVNLAGANFLLASETGAIIQSTDRGVSAKLKEVFDASKGYTVGLVFWNWVASISFNAIVNGTTGIVAAAPGVALTLANNTSLIAAGGGNGVSAGGVYVTDCKLSHQGEDLLMISGNAAQRGGVA